jgi:hypothetical protein
VADLRAQLEAALQLESETERKLAIAALIDEAVRDLGFRAIVIGGVAVEFWTHGAYSTGDIDLYLPHGPAVDERLAALGLRREGRHWVDPEHDLFVKAPASFPAPSEEVAEVRLSTGRTALVLAPEDVLIYRLHEFVATGHRDVVSQAVSLLTSPEIDRRRLRRRANDERLGTALSGLERLADRAAAGEVLESYELQEIARDLRGGSML